MEKALSSSIVKAAAALGAVLALAFALAGCSGSQGAASSGSDSLSGEAVAPVESSQASSGAGEQAGAMSIELTLTEDVTKATDVDTPLQFSDEKVNVYVDQGGTALDALQSTGREVITEGDGDSVEVTSIGGLANGAAGDGSHWEFSVNGQTMRESPAVYVLSEGDQVTFTFIH